MSFQQLIIKANGRSQLEQFNENAAVVFFDRKVAYEHLVDQRKTLEKGYKNSSNLRAVDHDQAVEDARDRAERAKDREAYNKTKEAEARHIGFVETDDEERYGSRATMRDWKTGFTRPEMLSRTTTAIAESAVVLNRKKSGLARPTSTDTATASNS